MSVDTYKAERETWVYNSEFALPKDLQEFDKWLEDEIMPYVITQDTQVDTKPLQRESYSRALEKVEEFTEDIFTTADRWFLIRPWDELSPQEKRYRMAKWKEQQEKSHVPGWAKELQKWVTRLDDIEDILSSAAAISRLGAFLIPQAAPILAPLSAALELAALAFDIPKDLLAVPLGPMGLKRTYEDAGKLLHPWKTIKTILKKEAPKTLKEAMPGLGTMLEIGQAAKTLTGHGISLGPMMGAISNVWFGALEKVGITHSEHPHKKPPHHSPILPENHGMPIGLSFRTLEHETGRSGLKKLQYIQFPISSPDEGKFYKLDLGIEGVFRQPTGMEFWALRTWENAFCVMAHPGGIEEDVQFHAIFAMTTTMPWAFRYLQDIEWWKIAEAIGGEKVIPYSPAPSFGTKWLESQGVDPYTPQRPISRRGDDDITYDEYIKRNAEYIAMRIHNMLERHRGTYQSFVLNSCINYLGNAIKHALNTDPLELIGTREVPATGAKYEVYRKTTEVETTDPYPIHMMKRVSQWGWRIPPDATNDQYQAFQKEYSNFVNATGTYPKFGDVTCMLFKNFDKVIWRGETFSSLEEWLNANPWANKLVPCL